MFLPPETIINKGLSLYNQINIPQFIEEKVLMVVQGKIKEIKKMN